MLSVTFSSIITQCYTTPENLFDVLHAFLGICNTDLLGLSLYRPQRKTEEKTWKRVTSTHTTSRGELGWNILVSSNPASALRTRLDKWNELLWHPIWRDNAKGLYDQLSRAPFTDHEKRISWAYEKCNVLRFAWGPRENLSMMVFRKKLRFPLQQNSTNMLFWTE